MEVTRHFTATTIIVYDGKALLHLHKKLKLWLPVGGHIDRDELPEEAAVREVKEESGLDVTLFQSDMLIDFKEAKQLNRPQHILLENINPYHQHIDFIYLGRPTGGTENGDFHWFTLTEVQELQDIFDETKQTIKQILTHD